MNAFQKGQEAMSKRSSVPTATSGNPEHKGPYAKRPLVKVTARIQRVHKGKHRRKETAAAAAKRALVDLALLQVMRDGMLRVSNASAFTWGNIECMRTAASGPVADGPDG